MGSFRYSNVSRRKSSVRSTKTKGGTKIISSVLSTDPVGSNTLRVNFADFI